MRVQEMCYAPCLTPQHLLSMYCLPGTPDHFEYITLILTIFTYIDPFYGGH